MKRRNWTAIRGLLCLVMTWLAAASTTIEPAGADPAFEARVLAIINAYRPQKGRAALEIHPRLHQLARQHSQRMAATNRISHDGYHQRIRQSGFAYCFENVGWNYRTPQALVQGWQRSAGHNRNLLQQRIRYAGLAKVGPYVTFFACG